MWSEAISTAPAREVLDRVVPFRGYTLRMFGIPESEIAKSLREIETQTDLSSLEVTTCLRRGEIEVDVRYRDGAQGAADALRLGMAERHGRFLFSEDGQTIDEQVALLLRGRKLGIGESCTGGLLAARITARPGASEFLAGSVVAYSNQSKAELLGVDPELIARHGAVSPEVAEAMATGALGRFDADTAVSVTGIAGPDGGTEDKPVGYVCLCALLVDGRRMSRDPVIPGGREDIRERSALVAMHMLRILLSGAEAPL
jgi:nicotinamide-nucleotide amidase